MPGHEDDGMRRHFFGGDHEVAFIFSVFVVHQDYEFAFFDVPEGVFDAVKWSGHRGFSDFRISIKNCGARSPSDNPVLLRLSTGKRAPAVSRRPRASAG